MIKNMPIFEKKPLPNESPITSYGEIIDAKEALQRCGQEMSFTVDTASMRQRIMGFASRLGIEVRTRKKDAGRYDIWRL